jgi:ribose 5-phosphate isomerase RpiB
MKVEVQHLTHGSDGATLHWAGRVLCADDLARHLNGHRSVVLGLRTIVTPLAVEELRGRGVRVVREDGCETATPAATVEIAQDREYPLVRSARQALAREGVEVRELATCTSEECRWARAVAECIARGECAGGVIFCLDPGLVCCVANKLAGLRAAAVTTVQQAARATLTLGANLLAVEMPGRTYFEVRQILRLLCDANGGCPAGVACTLQELDGHAHR